MRTLAVVKTAILPKLIYRFNDIPVKIPDSLFAEVDEVTLKFMLKWKGSKITKMILKKKKKVLELKIDFKTYYKVTVIQTVWC